MRRTTAIALATLALASPDARAELAVDGAAPYAAQARIDFRIIIPAYLRLQVGSAGATIDEITFAPTVANLGSGALVNGNGGNALGGSGVTVNVQGSGGQITITATNNSGGLGLGTGTPADGYIDYSQIEATSNSIRLPTPALTNAGGTTALPTLNAGKVTDRQANWRFRYLNQTIPSAGSYGTAANGGRVTYTATTP